MTLPLAVIGDHELQALGILAAWRRDTRTVRAVRIEIERRRRATEKDAAG